MARAILVLNAGSSSLKFSAFPDEGSLGEPGRPAAAVVQGQIESLLTEPHFRARDATGTTLAERRWRSATLGHDGAVAFLLEWLRDGPLRGVQLSAAGHRVVHGGLAFTEPVRVDADVIAGLDKLVPLAPLHQPHNIAAIQALAQRAPQLPQVACFDTSYHRTQPVLAQTFALPRRFSDEGVRRYGFHGLSYEYIASVLPAVDAESARGRVIVAHLGNGASMCAIRGGQSVATTMGFTAVDGLPMGTRCGALDPGVVLYLMDQHGMGARALETLVYHESGLLGVSGRSSDMRILLGSDDPHAIEAVDLFVYRIGRELGSLAAALGGLDAVVFTGGIGENATTIRARVCQDAAWLGIELDPAGNEAGGPRITRMGSRVRAWVVATNEELMIARHTRRVLGPR